MRDDDITQPWADHVIRGLKNPKFFGRKVRDLSVDELQAIESQWLPKVREKWDQVTSEQRADAEAFEAAIAWHFKRNPPIHLRNQPSQTAPVYPVYTPEEIRAKLKRLSPYAGPFIPDLVRENAKDIWGPDYPNHGHWEWEDGSGFYQCELLLCDVDVATSDIAGYVAIRPLGDGRYLLNFVVGGPEWNWNEAFHPEDLIFDSSQEAKGFLDNLLAASTPEIPIP